MHETAAVCLPLSSFFFILRLFSLQFVNTGTYNTASIHTSVILLVLHLNDNPHNPVCDSFSFSCVVGSLLTFSVSDWCSFTLTCNCLFVSPTYFFLYPGSLLYKLLLWDRLIFRVDQEGSEISVGLHCSFIA